MDWSKEDKLILSILNQDKESPVVLKGINMDRFIHIARKEGLSGILFKILKKNGLINIFPSFVQKTLMESYLMNLSYNMILMKDIGMVLSSLEEKGVKTVVFKGAALLERVYYDIGVRQIADIDLLFYDGEDENAGKILEGLGYRLISTCPMIYDNGRTVIDIHTEIDSFTRLGTVPYSPKLDTAKLWEDGCPWKEDFRYIRILSPEDNVLTLSIHLLKHSFLRLFWLFDIIEVVKANPHIDWEKLRIKAKEAGFEKLLFYVLALARQFFGLIPQDFLSEIKPRKLGFIEKGVIERILKNQRTDGYGDILYLFMINGAFRKILFVMKVLFPAKEKLVGMPDFKYPYLFYVKRVFGFSIIAGKVLWNYVVGSQSTTHGVSEEGA